MEYSHVYRSRVLLSLREVAAWKPHSFISNLHLMRILQAFRKSRKTYENQEEVHWSFIAIQSTDNFILL
jgi:hypothetical protein